jgi:hypothetical protein
MKTALKELSRFILDGAHLQSGDPFKNFGDMRSREAVANWLICAAVNSTAQRELSFTSDPIGGDGILEDAKTGETFQTEHVMVPRQKGGEGADAHELVLDAIGQKRKKGGAAYASGKLLVVFLDAGAGEWFPNRVARTLPTPLHFDSVWVVGLQPIKDGEYTYGVTLLDLSDGNAPTYIVRITKDFDDWTVRRHQ